MYMKIAADLGQIVVVLHTLLVIIEMPPRLNKQNLTEILHRYNFFLQEGAQLSRDNFFLKCLI